MDTIVRPVGVINSLFKFKNGTPRQPALCPFARGTLTIEKTIFNNPQHSLDGLEAYSHVWLIFIFHKNNNDYIKAKVRPPRLNGKRVGLFSTRSPYRPNPIGLTLAKLDKIEGDTLHLSGIDLLDGTPVLDIKPYIPEYDVPRQDQPQSEGQGTGDNINDSPGKMDANTAHKNETFHDTFVEGVDSEDQYDIGKEIRGDNSCETNSKCKEIFDDQAEVTYTNQNKNEYSVGVSSRTDVAGETTDDVCNNQKTEISQEGEVVSENKEVHAESCKDKNTRESSDCLVVNETILNYRNEEDLQTVDDSAELSVIHSATTYENTYQGTCNTDQVLMANMVKPCDIEKSHDDVNTETGNLCLVENDCQNKNIENQTENIDRSPRLKTAQWINSPPIKKLVVQFTSSAERQLGQFSDSLKDPMYKLQFLHSLEEAKSAISSILQEDPRSVYRRKHCQDSLYYFAVDVLHVTCWFDSDVAEVVRIKPVSLVSHCQSA